MAAITLNKIVFDILEELKGFQISDDSDIDERQIAFHVHTQRELLIREMLKNGGSLDTGLEQDLGCLEVIEVDSSECCEITTDCYILRTQRQLPQFIDADGEEGITRVAPVDKLSLPFSFISYKQAIYSGEGKYNGKMIFAFLLNDYIYLKSKEPANNLIQYLNVRGVLFDPTEAKDFNRCDVGSPCYTDNTSYPIYGWMIPIIKSRIFKEILGPMQIPKDASNDAKDNVDSINKN